MTKEQKTEPKLVALGAARRLTKGLPIGTKQEALMVGFYD